VIAAVGMAMPALVTMSGTFAAGYRGDPADIDSAVLTGLLEALRHGVGPTAPPRTPASTSPHGAPAGSYARSSKSLYRVDDVERFAVSCVPPHQYVHVYLLIHRAASLGLSDTEDVKPYIALDTRRHERAADALEPADARIAQAPFDGTLTGVCSRLPVTSGPAPRFPEINRGGLSNPSARLKPDATFASGLSHVAASRRGCHLSSPASA
jgi:hypothetical protein